MTKISDYLMNQCNTNIAVLDLGPKLKGSNAWLNPNLKNLGSWVKFYLGKGSTALYKGLGMMPEKYTVESAIRDENRNAIIPSCKVEIENREYFLCIKGCGAYTDLFSEKVFTAESVLNAYRGSDPKMIEAIKSIEFPEGIIMSENWMNESPYGGQGEENALRELSVSTLATKNSGLSINGAYICPLIAAVRLPESFERVAREFYWFRRYPNPFHQCIRLVPSNIRLYFESDYLISDHNMLETLFGLNTVEKSEKFLMNFIKSGCAIISLFVRTARRNKKTKEVEALCYHDVWFDKDCVVASDGVIHFADLEGWLFKSFPDAKVEKEIKDEWHKLIFEFLNALINVFVYHLKLKGYNDKWINHRRDLADLVYMALQNDDYCYPKYNNGNLEINLSSPEANIKPIAIPFLENIN